MKKLARALFAALFFAVLMIPVTAEAKTPPSQVTGYVGNIVNLEEQYNITLGYIEDTDVYNYDGECNKVGSTSVDYYDNDAETYGTFTVNVKNNKDLRVIGIEWNSSKRTVKIKMKNISSKKITIYSKGAKYSAKKKSQSRKMKLKKGSKVTIYPGKVKTVTFKVSGKAIKNPKNMCEAGNWFKMKCKFGGKIYKIKLNLAPDTCNFYKYSGGKWKFIDTNCAAWDYWM